MVANYLSFHFDETVAKPQHKKEAPLFALNGAQAA
jgi:hypothetical protein